MKAQDIAEAAQQASSGVGRAFVDQATRGAPAVGGAVLYGFSLNSAVAVVTIVYVVIQAAYLVRKWWREETEPRGSNATR